MGARIRKPIRLRHKLHVVVYARQTTTEGACTAPKWLVYAAPNKRATLVSLRKLKRRRKGAERSKVPTQAHQRGRSKAQTQTHQHGRSKVQTQTHQCGRMKEPTQTHQCGLSEVPTQAHQCGRSKVSTHTHQCGRSKVHETGSDFVRRGNNNKSGPPLWPRDETAWPQTLIVTDFACETTYSKKSRLDTKLLHTSKDTNMKNSWSSVN